MGHLIATASLKLLGFVHVCDLLQFPHFAVHALLLVCTIADKVYDSAMEHVGQQGMVMYLMYESRLHSVGQAL